MRLYVDLAKTCFSLLMIFLWLAGCKIGHTVKCYEGAGRAVIVRPDSTATVIAYYAGVGLTGYLVENYRLEKNEDEKYLQYQGPLDSHLIGVLPKNGKNTDSLKVELKGVFEHDFILHELLSSKLWINKIEYTEKLHALTSRTLIFDKSELPAPMNGQFHFRIQTFGAMNLEFYLSQDSGSYIVYFTPYIFRYNSNDRNRTSFYFNGRNRLLFPVVVSDSVTSSYLELRIKPCSRCSFLKQMDAYPKQFFGI